MTSYSNVDDYLPYQVPEVWIFKNDELSIYQLGSNGYLLSVTSQYLPSLNVHAILEQYRRIAYEQSSSQAIRQLRRQFS